MATKRNFGITTLRFNQGIIVSGTDCGNGTVIVTGSMVISGSESSSALDLYTSLSGQYAVVIDNDESSAGHGLKVTSDGSGTGTNLLDVESGTTTVFRVRGDGRVGVGTTTLPAKLTVSSSSGSEPDIAIANKIQHLGDSDTYIEFTVDDINIQAGGIDFIKITEDGSQDKIVFNDGGADVDFIVESPGEALALYLNAGNDVFHINHGENNFKTKIHSSHGEAITVNSSGVTLNEDGHATNDLRVESDNNTHMFFIDAGNDSIAIASNTVSGTDTNFLVSGSISSRGTTARGTSVFGGDMVISGGLSVDGSTLIVDESNNMVGIGTTTPDNLLTVVGGHISSDGGVRTGTVHFSWSARTTSFAAGTEDLVSYISFGNNSVWGWVEVTLTDDHIGVQTTGKYTKRYQIGRNIDAAVGHQSFEVPANLGSVVDQWNLGPFEVDSNDLRIPIHRLTTLQNSVTVFVEGQLHVASLDTADNVLNSLSLSTPAVVSNSATRDYYSIMSDRVGIGTTDPTYTLDVAGNIGFDEYLRHNDDTDTYLRLLPDTFDIICGGVKLISYYETGNDAVHVNPQNGDVNFIVDSDTEDNSLFVEGSSGNVGIGTGTPAATLQISGSDSANLFGIRSDSNIDLLVVTGSGRVGINAPNPGSTLQISGSVGFLISSFAASHALDETHTVAIADCNGDDVTLTLPPAADAIVGRKYIIKRLDSGGEGGANSLIIARNGAVIDGAASNIGSIENQTSHTLICLGASSGWALIDKYVGI